MTQLLRYVLAIIDHRLRRDYQDAPNANRAICLELHK